MGCQGSEDEKTADKFSNESVEHTEKAEGDQIYDKHFFKELNGPEDLWNKLTKDTDGVLNKRTAVNLANSAFILLVLDGPLRDPEYFPVVGRIIRRSDKEKEIRKKLEASITDKVRIRNTEALDVVFDTIDQDHSGVIERAEFDKLFLAMEALGRDSDDEEGKKLKQEAAEGIAHIVETIVDLNHNGSVSADEVAHVTTGITENLVSVAHIAVTTMHEALKDVVFESLDCEEIKWSEVEGGVNQMKEQLKAMGIAEEDYSLKDFLTKDLPESVTESGMIPGDVLAIRDQIKGVEDGKEVDAVTDALCSEEQGPEVASMIFAGILLHKGVDLLVEFAELLQSKKGCNKNGFAGALADFASGPFRNALHSAIDFVQGVAKAVQEKDDKPEFPEPEALEAILKLVVETDIKKIVDAYGAIYSRNAHQIYEGLFEVAKLGKTSSTLEDKTVDAATCFIVGGSKLEDRPKMIFDAFDHDGNGTLGKEESKRFVLAVEKTFAGVAHNTITSHATFFCNHVIAAYTTVLFDVAAEDHTELKLQNVWALISNFGYDQRTLAYAILSTKYGMDEEACQEARKKIDQKFLSEKENSNEAAMIAKFLPVFVKHVEESC